jgi:hypothetical protein
VTLYRITTEPQQVWYLTCKRRAIVLANAFSRIISPEHDVVVDAVTTVPALSGLNGGPFTQPPTPYVVDRKTQTRWRKPQPFQGYLNTTREVYRVEGRGHLFTPAEKRKTYVRTLQRYIDRRFYIDLAPLTDLVMLNRTELPLGRWLQSQKKLKENT